MYGNPSWAYPKKVKYGETIINLGKDEFDPTPFYNRVMYAKNRLSHKCGIGDFEIRKKLRVLYENANF